MLLLYSKYPVLYLKTLVLRHNFLAKEQFEGSKFSKFIYLYYIMKLSTSLANFATTAILCGIKKSE